VMQHKEMASRASEVIKYVTKSPATLSLEAGIYLHAVETMSSMRFGFQDVELFFFKPNLSVLLNLIGLIYCIQHLKPRVSYSQRKSTGLSEHFLTSLTFSFCSESKSWMC
jgi:hypothetical protein